jgi:diguanylate cyclase (GGDEF)-like protein/PAS domain S-box-containing protein
LRARDHASRRRGHRIAARFGTALRAKIIAGLFAACGTLALLAVLLPRADGANETGLAIVVVADFAAAAGLFFASGRVKQSLLPALLASASTLITAVAHFSDESPSPLVFVYLWVVLYAAYFFSRRQAAVQGAYVAVTYTWLLMTDPPPADAVAWGVVAMGTLLVAATVTVAMRTRVETLVERLHGAERDARAAGTRLQSILDHLPLAIYLRGLDGRYQIVNSHFADEYGLPPDQIIGKTSQQLHPEALNEWATELERPIRERGEAVAGESAAPHADGTEHYHWVIKYPVTDGDGNLAAIGGAILDITDRRRAELAVAEAEAEQAALRRVATSVAQGAGPTVVFGLVAREVAQLLGVELGVVSRFEGGAESRVLGRWTADPAATFPSTIKLDDTSATGLVARTGRTSRMDRYHPDTVAGNNTTMGVAAPITIAGKLWGAVGAGTTCEVPLPANAEERVERFAELAATAIGNAEASEALARLAATDGLTGVPNYRTFRDRLTVEGGRAERHDRPLSLVMLDVDHFKTINDRHGHGVGDGVLVEFARRLTAQVRSSDLVARVGGEEFAVLLPETGGSAAGKLAERLRKAVEAEPFDVVGKVTVSVGVCSLDASDGAESLVGLADTAMYWAKSGGRNATCSYSEEARAASAAGSARELAVP